eukprot:TRINITY_DN17635_c0_g1_i1.p1 TRINITY_DN17635_c0_g1~~TRINITY_DN17635_c0_g1_i1.p1  ORF type:complete len:117 (-),score=10.86 TRINITY_DN17635_c0_g1_i1:130-480(-)
MMREVSAKLTRSLSLAMSSIPKHEAMYKLKKMRLSTLSMVPPDDKSPRTKRQMILNIDIVRRALTSRRSRKDLKTKSFLIELTPAVFTPTATIVAKIMLFTALNETKRKSNWNHAS